MKKNKILIANTCFAILFVALFVLALVFQYDIQFWANGFGEFAGKPLQVYYLDVGQANSSLVILPSGRSLLIDTGSGESKKEFLKSVKKVLKQNGLEEIDILILTHSDEDHVGGTAALLKEFQVNSILRPKELSASPFEIEAEGLKKVDKEAYNNAITAIYTEPNAEIDFVRDMTFVEIESECVIEVIAGEKEEYKESNAYSPFVLITYQEKSFLFCGDATAEREKEFVSAFKAEGRSIEIDFLLVSHHGAKDSNTDEFLSFVKPRFAVVSSGDSLHPTKDVLDRLKSVGTEKIYCTKTEGLVGVSVNGKGVFVVKTMSVFVDLPFTLSIIFVIGAVWSNFLLKERNRRKFSY